MGRLIAAGCSFTFGEGFPDCMNPPNGGLPPFPSKHAWPSLVSKRLGMEVINLGVPGASNRAIANKILNFNFLPDDILVILWTECNRSSIFKFNNTPDPDKISIQPHMRNKINKVYYRHLHDYYNSFLESIEQINLANLYVKSTQNKVKTFNFYCDYDSDPFKFALLDKENNFKIPEWNTVDLISQTLYYVDLAADKDHPGIKSQKLIARDILKKIK